MRSGGAFTFGPFLSLSDSIFIEVKTTEEKDGVTTVQELNDRFTESLSVFSGRFTYGSSLSTSVLKRISQENGDFTLITSRANGSLRGESKSASSTQKYEIQKEKRKLEYLGSVSKFGQFASSAEFSVTYIETVDFDPCMLEQSSLARAKGVFGELALQGRQDLKINCMLSEQVEGSFVSSLVITDSNGELLRKVDLTGSLTAQVSEAMTVKYARFYLRGTDPIEDEFSLGSQNQGEDNILPPSNAQLFGEGIQIGQTYFVSNEQIQGHTDQIELSHKRVDDETKCSHEQKAIFKIEDQTSLNAENKNLYSFKLSRECEKKSSEATLSNEFSQDGNQAVVLSFTQTKQGEDEQTAFRRRFNVDLAKVRETQDWFVNFNITHRRAYKSGAGVETGFDLFYAQDRDSYVVAKQILVAPLYRSDSFRELQKNSQNEETPLDLKDVNLCFKVSCNSIGTAVTFKEDGGLFFSAEGRTAVDIFGKEVGLTLTSGFGLNSRAENEGFGSSSFFTNDRENFVELSLDAPGCNKKVGGCAGLNLRKEESKTQLIFGGSFKF